MARASPRVISGSRLPGSSIIAHVCASSMRCPTAAWAPWSRPYWAECVPARGSSVSSEQPGAGPVGAGSNLRPLRARRYDGAPPEIRSGRAPLLCCLLPSGTRGSAGRGREGRPGWGRWAGRADLPGRVQPPAAAGRPRRPRLPPQRTTCPGARPEPDHADRACSRPAPPLTQDAPSSESSDRARGFRRVKEARRPHRNGGRPTVPRH